MTVNRTNYKHVAEYLDYVQACGTCGLESIARYRFYLKHLLLWAGEVPLSDACSIRQPFPEYAAQIPSPKQAGTYLAAESQKKLVGLARRFFEWAKSAYGTHYRSITPLWIKTMRPVRPSTPPAVKDHDYVTLDEVLRLATWPIDRSNLALWATQASAAMLFLSGQRSGAYVTTPICAISIEQRLIEQRPELGVHTKNGKSATTYLLPIPELLEVVGAWDAYVRKYLAPQSVWYAPVISRWGSMSFSDAAPGRHRNQALVKRFNQLYALVGLPYKHPHLFRHGHAVYGLKHCRTLMEYQAVSRNLMHSNVQITDAVYAGLESKERARLIAGLSNNAECQPGGDLTTLLNQISPGDYTRAIYMLSQRML